MDRRRTSLGGPATARSSVGRRRGAVARPGPASPPARVRALILALVLAALAAACSGGGDEASPAGVGGTDDAAAADATLVVSTTTTAPPDPGPDPVPALLASLTVEEKIGQLLMPQLFGRSGAATGDAAALNESAHGSASPTDLVTEHHLGGVIYLADNIATAQQVRAFSRDLQNAATGTNGIGLLVAVDQEGGRISRLSDEMSAFPSAADLSGDADQVRVASYVTGQQVQQQGINVVLAPVADVLDPSTPSFIDDRSFGDDAEQVARMVGAAVDGLQDAGVAAAVKHWPGHGATPVDSHRLLPSLDIDRELWEQRERLPFETAIDRDVAIVLVGHLALPQLDASGAPATVSSVLIDELLRRELGFDGVVMTDALNMGAVGSIPERELVVDAVLAGVDIVLIPPSLSEATDALRQAVADGTITEARLDASVTRVLRLKERLGLLPAAG